MPFQIEFPDYPAADMPVIPAGFVDGSWHNDACPFFLNEAAGLCFFADYPKAEDRESGGKRFVISGFTDQITDMLLETDDWSEAETFIRRRVNVSGCQENI